MKEGQVIENYQGRYAKIVSIQDGRYGLTAFMKNKSDAEKEVRVARHLNKFGMGQILAPEKKTAAKKEEKKTEDKK